MVALYIHIPFCERKCAYCDFVSYEGRANDMKDYVAALCKEIHIVRLRYGTMRLGSIFIGGGTPSTLPPNLADDIMNTLRRYFVVTSLTEVTIEANPGTLDSEKLLTYQRGGINRLSLGAQASQNKLLKDIGRIHVWEDVVKSVHMARAAGFDNISLDLMYGLPGQTLEDWKTTLKLATGLRTEHLSCYSLTLEDSTPMGKKYAMRELVLPDEDTERDMYDESIKLLGEVGFKHYEISNWAKPKHMCRHNLTYWHNDNYIGVGCSAHSCIDSFRYENVADIGEYIRLVNEDKQPIVASRPVDRENSMFETVMLELRLLQGLDMNAFKMRYGESFDMVFGEAARKLETQNLLERDKQYIRLTRKGLDLQNSVLVALME